VYDVSFTPNEPGTYKCMVLYKNKPVRSKCWIEIIFILLTWPFFSCFGFVYQIDN
jgi:hypothetical protein